MSSVVLPSVIPSELKQEQEPNKAVSANVPVPKKAPINDKRRTLPPQRTEITTRPRSATLPASPLATYVIPVSAIPPLAAIAVPPVPVTPAPITPPVQRSKLHLNLGSSSRTAPSTSPRSRGSASSSSKAARVSLCISSSPTPSPAPSPRPCVPPTADTIPKKQLCRAFIESLLPNPQNQSESGPSESQELSQDKEALSPRSFVKIVQQYLAQRDATSNAQEQESIGKTTSELQTAEQSLHSDHISKKQFNELQATVTALKVKLQTLQADQIIKRDHYSARKRLESHPNVWKYYKVLIAQLEQIFLACKVVASELVATCHTGTLDKAATGVKMLKKIASAIPIIGQTIDAVSGTIATGLEKLDHIRQTENLIAISEMVGTLSDIMRISEHVARVWSENYREQLEKLDDTPPQQNKTWLGKAKKKAIKENPRDKSAVYRVAEFAALECLGALLGGDIDADSPLSIEDQLLMVHSISQTAANKLKQAVIRKISLKTVTTNTGNQWQVVDFYRKPGIKTRCGDHYYGVEVDPYKYGYRFGTAEEAAALGLLRSSLTGSTGTDTPEIQISPPPSAPETPPTSLTTSAQAKSNAAHIRDLEQELSQAKLKQEQTEKQLIQVLTVLDMVVKKQNDVEALLAAASGLPLPHIAPVSVDIKRK